LGLRYVIFVEKGGLRGLLTKKDVWLLLNGADGTRMADREQLAAEHGGGEDDVGAQLLGDNGDDDEREGLG